MKHFSLLLFCLLLSIGWPSEAQNSTITISTPIHGSLALPIGDIFQEKLIAIDTYTGTILELAGDPGPNDFPTWDFQGLQIAYRRANTHSAFTTTSGQSQITETLVGYTQNDLFFPSGWSIDGNNLLYLGYISEAGPPLYMLSLVDVNSGALTSLISYGRDQIVNGIPLPNNMSSFRLADITQVDRNPFYDKWIAIEMQGENLADGRIVFINFLWNYETGQFISLDQLFSDPILDSGYDWTHDGTGLLFTTFNSQNRQSTLRMLRFTNNGELSIIDSAQTERNAEFWLDAGNLVLAWTRETETDDHVYYIGEIINGVWHEQEFLRLSGEEFSIVKPGDWFIRATDAEKQTLSCIFDQALPIRLSVALHARVNFTDGSPLRLRQEPDVYSTEIQQMPEGTEFDVVNGPFCRYGYRWWQLDLGNNTIGWAAEADETEYFIEPFSRATPTPTLPKTVETSKIH